jgi:heme O synthase-like polyprenyltransferase
VNWSVALRLGRVSNLPTVWTNTLAGIVLVGGDPGDRRAALAVFSLSLFYVAGMYLNDAFDREFDARQRPERPIPSGDVAVSTVFGAGFAMLLAGLLLLALADSAGVDGSGWRAPAAGVVLAAAIVFYDWHHKGNALSPLVMGLCRVLVYLTAALTVSVVLPLRLWLAAAVALAYLIGLTYIAKQETLRRVEKLWPLAFLAVPVIYGAAVATSGVVGLVLFAAFLGWVLYALSFLARKDGANVPRAVVSLIAGICLLDALFIVEQGQAVLAPVALIAFVLALALQRYVPGT